MTWTKLGDEFGPETRDLTDAEFRTHVEALGWSNARLLDLVIPKADVKRFAETKTGDADSAAKGLMAAGWWEDRGDSWYVGCRFPEWQMEAEEVRNDQRKAAERMRRIRKCRKGDHSLCTPRTCRFLKGSDERSGERAPNVPPRVPGRVGTGRNGVPPIPPDGSAPKAADLSGSCPHGVVDGPAKCALCRRGIGPEEPPEDIPDVGRQPDGDLRIGSAADDFEYFKPAEPEPEPEPARPSGNCALCQCDPAGHVPAQCRQPACPLAAVRAGDQP